MTVLRGVGPARPRAVLTLGKFDGVHAGHRHVAARTLELAGRLEATSVALILDPNPVTVLTGRAVPTLLTVTERRRRLLGLGLGRVELLAFDHDLAALRPEEFVARLLAHFDLAAVVVGPDFRFGHERAGDVATLEDLGRASGFTVETVAPLEVDGERVSSGHVRALLDTGDVRAARYLLRAPHQVAGTVVRGAARGRELGFPTANLALAGRPMLPANGVYTVRAVWSDEGRSGAAEGVASVGTRPTFDDGERLVEVYLLDTSADLYGATLSVELLAFQRPELKFGTVSDLVDQMGADVLAARACHAAEETFGWRPADEPSSGGRAWLCAAPDLPGLAEVAHAAVHGRDGVAASDEPSGGRTTPVAVAADDDAGLLAAWLDATAGAGEAHAYAITRGKLLGWGRGATPAPPRSTALGPLTSDDYGVAVRVTAPD